MKMIALMMVAASIAETSVNFHQTKRRFNPEDTLLCVLEFKLHFKKSISD
jgi:hypothetical protein